MTTIFGILIVAAVATFAYLVWRVGWKEATATVAVLFGALGAAFAAFFGSFTPSP